MWFPHMSAALTALALNSTPSGRNSQDSLRRRDCDNSRPAMSHQLECAGWNGASQRASGILAACPNEIGVGSVAQETGDEGARDGKES